MTTYSAHDIAAELRSRLPGVPVKKLHKLLYYCQGWHYATFEEPLFSETISAWDMGPVVGQLWYQEKQQSPPATTPAVLDEASLNTIGYVLSRYGSLSGLDLENLTHNEDPWVHANASREPGQSVKMPPGSIGRFFRENSAWDETESSPLDRDALEAWISGAEGRRAEELPEDSAEALMARAL